MFKNKIDPQPRERKTNLRNSTRTQNFSYHKPSPPVEANQRTAVKDRSVIRNRLSSGIRHVPALAVLLVLLIGFMYELGLSSKPSITVVKGNQGTQLLGHASSVYSASAQKILNSSITSRSKLTINTASIATKLRQEYPEIANVTVSLPLIGHQVSINIAVISPSVIINSPSQGSYLLSSGGTVLAHSSNGGWPNTRIPVINDQANLNAKLGEKAVASTDINFFELVIKQFQAEHVQIQSMVLPAESRELDVYIAGQPYYVKFNLNDDQDAGQQIGTYLAAARYLKNKNITPKQYIDARVLGRVYYK